MRESVYTTPSSSDVLGVQLLSLKKSEVAAHFETGVHTARCLILCAVS